MSLSHGKLCLRYSSVLFEKWGTTSFQTTTLNRTLEYLRHNFPLYRLISHQTDNPWPSYLQELNPPDYFLRGCLKDRVCENNPQTRQDIITKEIRRVAQEMLYRVVDNFIVRVAAVLSYSNAVHGTNIVLLKNYSKSLLIQEWFTQKEFYKLPVSGEKKSWRFPYFFKSYCQNKIETFFWATLYTGKILFKLVVLPLLSL